MLGVLARAGAPRGMVARQKLTCRHQRLPLSASILGTIVVAWLVVAASVVVYLVVLGFISVVVRDALDGSERRAAISS